GLARETGRKQIQAKSAEDVALRSEATSVLQARADALSKLIEENPQQALSMAFSSELAADLAETFPDSAGWLERHGSWEGPVEQWIYDGADLKSHSTLTQMRIGKEALEIHFAGCEPSGLTSGSVLQATGVQLGAKAVLNAATVQGVSAAAQSCPTTGPQNTVV